jgi:putative endonuclease
VADPRHRLGQRAEEAVATWLATAGWTILERRWRCPAGELDLICRDPGGTLVGVEVKLRSTGRAGTGSDSIDPRRLARLRAALGTYARGSAQGRELRLDLVTLTATGDGHWRVRRLREIDGW